MLQDFFDDALAQIRLPLGQRGARRHHHAMAEYRNGQPLDDPGPAITDGVRPGAEDSPAQRAELVAEKVDEQGRLFTQPLADLDQRSSLCIQPYK